MATGVNGPKDFWMGLLVFFGALIGMKALQGLMRQPCPVCGLNLDPGTTPCPNCKTSLAWQQQTKIVPPR